MIRVTWIDLEGQGWPMWINGTNPLLTVEECQEAGAPDALAEIRIPPHPRMTVREPVETILARIEKAHEAVRGSGSLSSALAGLGIGLGRAAGDMLNEKLSQAARPAVEAPRRALRPKRGAHK